MTNFNNFTTMETKKEKKGLIDLVYDRPLTSLGLAWIGATLISGIIKSIFGK